MAANYQLSAGCIPAILRGDNVERPIVQLLNHKKISSNNSVDRFRVIISDGQYFNSYAMLATQLNDRINNGELTENSIICLDQYVPSELPPGKNSADPSAPKKKIIVILGLTILQNGKELGKIGDPKNYDRNSAGEVPISTSSASASHNILPQHQTSVNGHPLPVNNASYTSSTDHAGPHGPIVPIVGLNPYQNRWCIKARIISKTAIRQWSNAKGEGKLFSMDLVDESASIRCTGFREQVDKFYDLLEINKVYYISRCSCKPANKQFTTIPHDYELTLNNESVITPCNDEAASIPQLQYNFTPLSALKDLAPDSYIDILGVCKMTGDIQNLIAKASRRELKKRDVTLVDQSDASVTLTLWGEQAEEFDGSNMPVLAIKSARLAEFNGSKSLATVSTSTIQINPDITAAHKLRGWFDGLGDGHQFSNVSTKTGGDGGKLYLLKEINTHQLGTHDKADYFNSEAVVLFVPHDRAIYQACPNADCKKKVLDQHNGYYKCEKCNQDFDSFVYRLLLNIQICDWTGGQWVSLFQEQAEELLQATAEEIGRSRDDTSGNTAYDAYFQRPLFKPYNFRLRAKMDTFNNENRMRLSVMGVKPVDFKEASRRLLNEIKFLSGVSIPAN